MNSEFDITIIGSGILSARTTLILAKQGLKVCLLSEKDFGQINKLNKIDIVDSSDIVYENYANNLVPIDSIIIDYKNSTFTKLYKQAVSKVTKLQYKNNNNLSIIEPQLKISNIKYATISKMHKFDYARVCIDTVLTAKDYGTKVYNYVTNININLETINFSINSDSHKIKTKLIIDLRSQSKERETKYFTIPRYKLELSNTTIIKENGLDIQITPYFSVVIIKSDINSYLAEILNKINYIFSKNIVEKEIIDIWHEPKNYSNIKFTENTAILNEDFSLNSSTKLDKLFSWIANKIGINKPSNFDIELHNNFKFEKRKTVIHEQVDKTFREVQQTNISPNEFTKLYYRYGSKFEIVIEKAFDFYTEREKRPIAWLLAQIWYAKNYEMTQTVDDFIYRRANIYFANYFDKQTFEIIEKYFSII